MIATNRPSLDIYFLVLLLLPKNHATTELYYACIDCMIHGNIRTVNFPCHVSVSIPRQLSSFRTDTGYEVDNR